MYAFSELPQEMHEAISEFMDSATLQNFALVSRDINQAIDLPMAQAFVRAWRHLLETDAKARRLHGLCDSYRKTSPAYSQPSAGMKNKAGMLLQSMAPDVRIRFVNMLYNLERMSAVLAQHGETESVEYLQTLLQNFAVIPHH